MGAEEQTSKVSGWWEGRELAALRRGPHELMARIACWPGSRGLRSRNDGFLWVGEHQDRKDDCKVAEDQKGRRWSGCS